MDDAISSSRDCGNGIRYRPSPLSYPPCPLLLFFTFELLLSIFTISLVRLSPLTVYFLYVLSLRLPLLDFFSSL